jgi:hypothetical protein
MTIGPCVRVRRTGLASSLSSLPRAERSVEVLSADLCKVAVALDADGAKCPKPGGEWVGPFAMGEMRTLLDQGVRGRTAQ